MNIGSVGSNTPASVLPPLPTHPRPASTPDSAIPSRAPARNTLGASLDIQA